MRSVLDAYLDGSAAAFFPASFQSAADRRRVVLGRPGIDPGIASVIEAQNARLAASPAREENLRRLAAGAAAVVTGQQVGVFLGPLFTTYKAATAIRAARALEAEVGRPVVPIFWLQTEDHDLAEVAEHHALASGGTTVDVSLPIPGDNAVSVAHLELPPAIEACLAALAAALEPLPEAPGHLERLARHYRPGRAYADAFAGVLAELFAEEGLIFVDPRVPELASAAGEVHHRSIERSEALHGVLAARSRALEAAGLRVAVQLRADAPLSFLHAGGASGPRRRPTGVAKAELLAVLARDPLAFSTSALLRPLLQDTLLPTAAYVGGPGEVAYFAQLSGVYEDFGITMPLIIPRARLRVIDDRTARVLARLGVTSAELARSEEELLRRAAGGRGGAGGLSPEGLKARLEGALDRELAELEVELLSAGPGLDVALSKTRQVIAGAALKLAEKYERATLQRDRELVVSLGRARAALFPGGAPQERRFGLASFAARFGERRFVERALAAAEPFAAVEGELHP